MSTETKPRMMSIDDLVAYAKRCPEARRRVVMFIPFDRLSEAGVDVISPAEEWSKDQRPFTRVELLLLLTEACRQGWLAEQNASREGANAAAVTVDVWLNVLGAGYDLADCDHGGGSLFVDCARLNGVDVTEDLDAHCSDAWFDDQPFASWLVWEFDEDSERETFVQAEGTIGGNFHLEWSASAPSSRRQVIAVAEFLNSLHLVTT